jgi:hypothetical protein
LKFDAGAIGVGSDIFVHPSLKLSSVLYWISQEMADIQRPICRWRLGRIACHQLCKNCNKHQLSRKHAVNCFGLEDKLIRRYDKVEFESHRATFMDTLLNKYFYGFNLDLWKDLECAISKISTVCLLN